MNFLFGVFIFLIGLCLGSFANVIVYRLKNIEKKERKISKSRSFCPKCKHKLGFFDLIPLFSYLFLGGKCRYCKEKISIQYPLVELVMGTLFLFSFLYLKFSPEKLLLEGDINNLSALLLAMFMIFVLVIVTAYDILYMEIPDEVILPAIIFLVILSILRTVLPKVGIESALIDPVFMPRLSDALMGLLIPVLFFIFQILISGGAWIGGGDLRIGALMGLLLGWQKTLVALAVGYSAGALFGLILILIYKKVHKKKAKKTLKLRIPFGPFLSLGTFIAYFFGDRLVWFYIKVLLDF